MYYYVRKKEKLEIKKLAGDLINLWSRPIIGRSLDYKSLSTYSKREEEEEDYEDKLKNNNSQLKSSKILQSENYTRLVKNGSFERENNIESRYKKLTSKLSSTNKKHTFK